MTERKGSTETPLLLRRRDVERLTGLSCAAIYRQMDKGTFPRPVKLEPGKRGTVRWRRRDIVSWVESLTVGE